MLCTVCYLSNIFKRSVLDGKKSPLVIAHHKIHNYTQQTNIHQFVKGEPHTILHTQFHHRLFFSVEKIKPNQRRKVEGIQHMHIFTESKYTFKRRKRKKEIIGALKPVRGVTSLPSSMIELYSGLLLSPLHAIPARASTSSPIHSASFHGASPSISRPRSFIRIDLRGWRRNFGIVRIKGFEGMLKTKFEKNYDNMMHTID